MSNVGQSPIDYLTGYRISEACSLLKNTGLSIAEIAVSVGFFDQFYFSRVFKKVKGVSPASTLPRWKKTRSWGWYKPFSHNVPPYGSTLLFWLPLSFYRQTDIFSITLEQTEQTMSLKKNQIFETTIENLSSDGSGVAHVEGQAVFVPGAAPGDVIRCRIVKALKSYAFGRIDAILAPGPGRVAPDCAVCTPCGGCGLRHLSYATECEAKTGFVRDAFARLGGFDVSSFEFSPVLALTDHTAHYRNKVQLPVGLDADGHVVTGFYAGRTHRIVPCPDCKLQPEWMNALARRACALLEANGIAPYDEGTGKGRVRHLYMRQGWHSGQRLLCFVVNGNGLPNEAEICRTLQQEFQLTTVLINRNTARTNVILGRDTRTVLGPGVIEDTLAGVPIQMGVHEFYQVNTPAAELLYAKAKEFARLQPDDFLLDLYCGMGTIGLSMKPHCRRLVGVEVVPQAVEGAKTVAAHLGLPPEEADFYCMDAGEAATRLASEGAHPDVIVVDPPRKGCDNATLTAIVQMAPRTLVMVSCNPSTAARDAKFLCEQGYTLEKVQPVDLFPRTRHVEAVLLLTKLNVERHIEVDVSMDELDMAAAESKATYDQIRDYVWEHHQLKVSNLYIAQVKQKYGIIERENYHKAKKRECKATPVSEG